MAAVQFDHSIDGADASAYGQRFGCPVEFMAGRNALLFAAPVLDRRLPHAQAEYTELLRDLCRQAMAQLTEEQGLVAAVRAYIRDIGGLAAGLEQAARYFKQSPRSLWRHLRQQGVSYRALLESVRFGRARHYLSTDQTVEQVAGRLGYADARSFRCAFRRWSGCSPSQFRSRASSEP